MERKELIRPAVWIGFSYFGALLAAAFLRVRYTPYICVGLLMIGLVQLLCRVHKKNPAIPVVVLTAAVAMGVYSVVSWLTVIPTERYIGNIYPVQAVLESEPEHSNGKYYYKARIIQIEEPKQSVNFSVRLSYGEVLDAEIGNIVSCSVKFFSFQDRFGLSSYTSQLADGKVLGAYITDYESISVSPSEKKTLSYWCASVRSYMRDKILRAYPGEEASVLNAMLLGLRGDISEDLEQTYKTAGATHILVISGMHMAIVAQFALSLFCLFGIRKRYAAGLSIGFIILFMAVSGMSATVARSGIMQILLLVGLMLGRQADSLNSLAIAVLCLALSNPFCVGDISLLLSFSATLGIIVFSPRITSELTKRIQKPQRKERTAKLLMPVSTSVSAILGSIPVQLYVFGTINLSSLLSSLMVLYASAWIIRLGVPAVLCISVPLLEPVAAPLVFLSGLLIRYQNFAVGFVGEHLPETISISGAYLPGAVLIIVLFLLLVFWVCGGKRIPLPAYGLAAVLFGAGILLNTYTQESGTRLLVLDSGYAQCTAWIDGHDAAVLQCSGSGSSVVDALKEHGVDTVRFLHVGDEESEIRCAEKLSEAFPAETVLTNTEVYFPSAPDAEIYDYGCTVMLSKDMALCISENGDRAFLTVYGRMIFLESGVTGVGTECADILITDREESSVSAPLTILQTEKKVEEVAGSLSSGDYLLSSEHESILLDFETNGGYRILNG